MTKPVLLLRSVVAKASRVSLSMAGTLAIAGSNFLLSLVLIPLLAPADYGFFIFGQVLTAFSYSIVNAMGGTPLSISLNRGTPDWQPEYLAIMKVDAILSVLAGLVAVGSGFLFGMPLPVTLFMGLFTFAAALRWGFRCAEFARHRVKSTGISDLIYACVVITGCAIMHVQYLGDTLLVASITVATAASLSAAYLWLTLEKVGGRSRLSHYGRVWRGQSRWALLGVITTEMTSNGHAYLVTFMAGPQAFAPIAVAALFWRPLTVVLPSLMLIERPIMARQLAKGDVEGARGTARSFLRLVLTILAGNVVLAVAVSLIFHDKVVNLPYEPSTLYVACGLWFIVVLIQSMRIPASSLIQAAGQFKPLAKTSLIAAPVTMMVAAGIIYMISPIASIVGIIAGEVVMTTLVFRLTRRTSLLAQAA